MPTFFYTAKSQTGEEKSGTQTAENKKELAHSLRQEGYILTSARILGEKKESKIDFSFLKGFLKKVPLTEKIIFSRHLSVMIKAGLSLNQALEILAKQTKNPKFAKIIEKISQDIQKGLPFSEALAKYPQIFSELFINMIKVGETAGNLEEVLKLLANQMEKDYNLISKVKGAMVYPIIILIAMIGIGFLMMIVVIPKLTSIFSELKIELPLTTRIVIAISNFLSAYAIFVLIGLIILIILIKYTLKTEQGQKSFSWLVLHLPLLKDVIKKINSARFARILSSLIEGGVPIVKSLEIVSHTLTNIYYVQSLNLSAEQIQKGEQLSVSLNNYPDLYPPMVTQMIQVGEKTGTLGNILEELADFYEEEISNFTKNLTAMIEPILMIIIGAAVGFFAVSIIRPIYSLMEGL